MAVQNINGLQSTCFKHNKPLRSHSYLMMKLMIINESRIFPSRVRFIMLLGLIIVLLLPWLGLGWLINNESSATPNSSAADHIHNNSNNNNNNNNKNNNNNIPINLELFSLVFHDLRKEGILKQGGINGLLLSNDEDEAIHSSLFLKRTDMEFISSKDLERQRSVPNDFFDLTYTQNFREASAFIDRTLKVGGLVAVQLSAESDFSFDKPYNYRIIYFRNYPSNAMVMMKGSASSVYSATRKQRRLLEYYTTFEAKKAALRNLEDVLLEPPRAASRKSKTYLKRTKFLPDLLGDTLEGYPRRVFIDVGLPEKEGGGATSWFAENYPTRNLKFDMYKIETLTKESSRIDEVARNIGMSDWLRENVKEQEFVVMKAEAQVVEEMVKSKAIRLVDELFLECKPQEHQQAGRKINMGKRAYWECLALYGKLRDEGVAVHQWWG